LPASNSSTEPPIAGRIGRPHGLRGEVTVVPEDPAWFTPGAEMSAGDRLLVVGASRPYRDRGLVVSFEGVSDRGSAEALRGTVLCLAATPELGEGEYWPEDLIGLEAVRPDGSILGTVTGVVFGPQDRLVVETPSGSRAEVPFVSDLVGDPADGRIVVDPPEGLFGDATA